MGGTIPPRLLISCLARRTRCRTQPLPFLLLERSLSFLLSNSSSRPSRGAKPRGADDRKLPQRQPRWAGLRGGGEIKAGVPHEEPVTQAMTIETRRAPGRHRLAQCPCFPFGANGASTCQGIRQGLPFRCNETKTSRTARRRSPWSPRRRHHQCFWQPKTTFGQDNLYYMFPFKMANCWRPSRSLFGKRPRASINRASLHKEKGGETQ